MAGPLRNQKMDIRPATLQDAKVIAEYNIALARESEGLVLDSAVVRSGVEAVLRDRSKGIYFCAVFEGNVIGQIMITYEWSEWRNGVFWWLQSVYVHAEHRSRGVFKSLLTHAVQEAAEAKQVCGFRLYVETHNENAQRAYQKLGFKNAGYHVFERLLP
jgi:ribosomal protein S18 acetylase RimI-like enzyme